MIIIIPLPLLFSLAEKKREIKSYISGILINVKHFVLNLEET